MNITTKSILLFLTGFTLLLSSSFAVGFKKYNELFKNLSPSDQKKFTESLNKGQKLASEKRMFEALDALAVAEKIIPNHPSIRLTDASIEVHFRNFAAAEKIYQGLYNEDPDNIVVLFNLGEMQFVQGKWKFAVERFEDSVAKTYTVKKEPIYYIAEYKAYICYRKLGNETKAQAIADKYDYKTDDPIYYYIQVEKALSNGDKETASRYQQRAARIFGRSAGLLFPYVDSLEESGYLESLSSGAGEIDQ